MPLSWESESIPPRCSTTTVWVSVFFIIGEAGLDEQLFTDEAGRRVAAFADISRGAQVPHRRLNGPGIAIEGHLDELLGAVHLGCKVRLCAGADVAGDAFHMGVGGDFVGRELGVHDVAGLSAELGRIHVRGTAELAMATTRRLTMVAMRTISRP